MEVRYPRFIHSEVMTHRVFCLAGDTKLYFDLPSGGADTRRYALSIAEFYEKWHQGAAARAGKARAVRIDDIDPNAMYDAHEASRRLGYRHYTVVNGICKRVGIERHVGPDGRYRIRGADLIAYALGRAEPNRYSLRSRLGRMRLRSCDEVTREIYYTNVRDVTFSGNQPVYRVTTSDGTSIVASAEHRFFTERGWETLHEAADMAFSANGKLLTWKPGVKLAVNGSDALRDREWLRRMRDRGYSARMIADRVGASVVTHGEPLETFWEAIGDLRLKRPYQPKKKRAKVVQFVTVIAIEYVGIRPTYDLEVTGPFHNFVADGFVVHNSRNAGSSRAIPIKKMIDAVRQDPAMPRWWGRNQSGMQAREQLDAAQQALAEAEWRHALADALVHAERLSSSEINLHKQLVNRILEPFSWITVIITATEWANFFTQRTHEDAQPELKHIAEMMLHEFRRSTPRPLALGEWHTPLILDDEEASLSIEQRLKISVARCARVSYLSHAGVRDHEKDVELYDKLVAGGANGHWSPFEHVATPLGDATTWSGNFRGWEQFRKRFPQEHASSLPDETPAALR
ncbi:MAG TPA: FAD-dependent thymidylate synthase [Candidatus Baltobacteraceae bacterium]|nr:FAD-dependent thymidylate synthase [Candidatus Baltobacteraceae bacterium]